MGDQAPVQLIGQRVPELESIDKGVGQIKTGPVYITAAFSHISRFTVEVYQRQGIPGTVGAQQSFIEIFCTHLQKLNRRFAKESGNWRLYL